MRQYGSLLFCLTTLLTLLGCEKQEIVDDEALLGDKTILYSSTVEATRATQVDLDALKAYGKMNVATFLTDDANTHYFTDEVHYNGTFWASNQTRYWPVDNNLNLFAYTPYADFLTVENSRNYADYSLRFVSPVDINKQVDLLAKSAKNQSYNIGSGSVRLNFKHLLSGVKFKIKIVDESHVTLNNITINYVGIEKERTYNFATEAWDDAAPIYFTKADGLSTTIEVNETATTTGGDTLAFKAIENQLMLLPQPIDHAENNAHYLSIQFSYTLHGAQDASQTSVITGVMPLPSPNSENRYKQGEVYTYTAIINGETILFKDLSIEDQNDPVPAYGNIDLDLIKTFMTASDIGYTETTETEAQYYFTSAQRVKNLLNDGVRDFVVVGSMGANSTTGENTLGNGKLGYYGSTSSPFYIGAKLAGLSTANPAHRFSVDLRGTYDYPKFKDANHEEGRAKPTTTSDDLIGDDEPILIAGLFAHIDWLDEVLFPHGIAAIGNHAFDNCDALRHLDIADVRHIEVGAFQYCKSLEVVDGGAITRIHENGFDSCFTLTTIDLSRLTEVDAYGFVDCRALTNVNLSKLDKIGKHAFNGCSNLTLQKGTEIPGFTLVEDFAFSGCYRLGENGSKIDLTQATKVGMHAFERCEHIALSSGDMNQLTKVGRYAFSGCTILGENQPFRFPLLDSIGEASFANCPHVNIVSGLENLKRIPYYAFQNCTSLTGASGKISLPEVNVVEGYGFSNTGVINIAFSDKLTRIEEHAFNESEELTTLSNLGNVNFVGNNAFSSCTSLEELSLPQLTSDSCGGGFFFNCTALKTLSLPLLTDNDVSWYDKEGKLHPSTIITMIDGNFKALESINLPLLEAEIPAWHIQKKPHLTYANFASVTAVGAGAFASSPLLETLILSSTTTVGDQAFEECESLATMDLGSARTIGNSAFINCTSLTSLALPLATTVGNSTFQGCTSLPAITLPEATSIGFSAFKDCSDLTSLNLPKATSIDASAYQGCTSLEELLLPRVMGSFGGWQHMTAYAALTYVDLSSITTLGGGTFKDCSNLEAVDLSNVTTVNEQPFINCNKLARIDLSGLTANSEIHEGIFWHFPNSTQCEIWLSDEQAEKASGNVWQGQTWAKIHRTSDGVPFQLK